MSLTPAGKSLRGQFAAHTSWANTTDRTARTANARKALEDKFLAEADGDPKRAESRRKAFYAQLAFKSAQARRRRNGGRCSLIREGRPGGETGTAQDPATRSSVQSSQIPPVGPHPGIDVCLVGALLWATPSDATTVLTLVVDEDIESIALATVLGAVRTLVTAGRPHGPQLTLDELRRTGELRDHNGVAQQLHQATTCGADPLAAWHYAGAVVGASLRRRVESYGVALTTAASQAPESDLAPHVYSATRVIGDCAQRLQRLRGDT